MARQSTNIGDALSSFAAAVKHRRNLLGLSQEELAWRAGLHRTYVTDIERGARNLSLRSIEKLAHALQASVAELFTGLTVKDPAQGDGSVEILLVEDNPDDVELTLRAFSTARMKNRIHAVQDGAAALDFLFPPKGRVRAWIPGRLIILLDLNLPKVSGLEVLRRIRADATTRELPVIVLTISDQDRDIAECRRLGCSYYIIKPVGFDNFSKITPQLQFDWKLVGRG